MSGNALQFTWTIVEEGHSVADGQFLGYARPGVGAFPPYSLPAPAIRGGRQHESGPFGIKIFGRTGLDLTSQSLLFSLPPGRTRRWWRPPRGGRFRCSGWFTCAEAAEHASVLEADGAGGGLHGGAVADQVLSPLQA